MHECSKMLSRVKEIDVDAHMIRVYTNTIYQDRVQSDISEI